MSDREEYHSQKLGSIVNLMIGICKKNPRALDNPSYLKAMMKEAMPELQKKDTCANCGASMKQYVFKFDTWDAILLLRMAAVVRGNQHKGMDFTHANQVRIPELDVTHAIKCRTTQASKLGLITQLKTKTDTRVPGVWLITRRGWDALAGKPVPAEVTVFRNKIEGRSDQMITIAQAMKSHEEYVKNVESRGKTPRQDFRADVKAYDPSEWYDFSYKAGAVL